MGLREDEDSKDWAHIIGVAFEVNAGEGMEMLIFYTSHPEGRCYGFYVDSDKIETSYEIGEYRGLYESSKHGMIWKTGGVEFTCKQGNRVTGMRFKDGIIVSIFQEPIPVGQNDKWWEISVR